MTATFCLTDDIRNRAGLYRPFLDRLAALFAGMDRDYQAAAAHYGFRCTGCEDNCCRTRFYHHTLAEYLLLMEGFSGLDRATRAGAGDRAIAVCKETTAADARGRTVRLMCPLNENSLCILYARRPMICRLHGIPHVVHRPGQGMIAGPGCAAFDRAAAQQGRQGERLDRTPYYTAMAQLERSLRQALGDPGRIKVTIAEMVVSYETR